VLVQEVKMSTAVVSVSSRRVPLFAVRGKEG